VSPGEDRAEAELRRQGMCRGQHIVECDRTSLRQRRPRGSPRTPP